MGKRDETTVRVFTGEQLRAWKVANAVGPPYLAEGGEGALDDIHSGQDGFEEVRSRIFAAPDDGLLYSIDYEVNGGAGYDEMCPEGEAMLDQYTGVRVAACQEVTVVYRPVGVEHIDTLNFPAGVLWFLTAFERQLDAADEGGNFYPLEAVADLMRSVVRLRDKMHCRRTIDDKEGRERYRVRHVDGLGELRKLLAAWLGEVKGA